MPSIWARQPGKGLYTVAFLSYLPLRLLLRLIYYVHAGFRPNSKWSYRQAIGSFAFGALWKLWTTVEYHPAKTLEAGAEGDRFISIQPDSKPDRYQGVLKDARIKPTTIAAMWYPRKFSPSTDLGSTTKVVLYFHGGAYVLGGCRPIEGGYGPETLAKAFGSVALAPQYHLAWQEDGHFPAAIQDGVTAYAHLISLGIKGENIILAGESAGGNLAVVLLRYLTENKGCGLPKPGGVCLISPWLDLTSSTAEATRANPRFNTDWLPADLPSYGASKYIPSGTEAQHPYISPQGNEFTTDVPIFMQTCDAECLYEPNVEFVETMRSKGAKVECHVMKGFGHDAFGAALVLGTVKEAEYAAAAAVKFLQN